jgi:hypothetical protein
MGKLNSTFAFRINTGELDKFEEKCKEINYNSANVLRILVEAFSDDRVQIDMSDEQKKAIKSLYGLS